MSRIWAPQCTIRNKSRHVWRAPRCHPISGWAWSAAWIHRLLGVCTLSTDQQLPRAAVRGCSLWKIQQNWWKQHTTKSEQVRKKWPPERGLLHRFTPESSDWKHVGLPNDGITGCMDGLLNGPMADTGPGAQGVRGPLFEVNVNLSCWKEKSHHKET